MVVLRIILTFIIALCAYSFEVKEVVVNCGDSTECDQITQKFNEIKNKNLSEEQLYTFFNFEVDKQYYKSFYFSLDKTKLNVDVEIKKKIGDINFEVDDSSLRTRLYEIFTLRKGDYYDDSKMQEGILKIQQLYFSDITNAISYNIEESDEGIEINVSVSEVGIRKFKKLYISGLRGQIERDSLSFWGRIQDRAWDKVTFTKHLDEYRNRLEQLGYWQASVIEKIDNNDTEVNVSLSVTLGPRYGINFYGVNYFDHQYLFREIKKIVRGNKDVLTDSLMIHTLAQLYKNRGVFYSDFDIRKETGADDKGDYYFFFVNVKEGRKIKIDEVIFSGNQDIDNSILEKIYDEKSSDLLNKKYLDVQALEKITNNIREYYVSHGYVFSSVEQPLIAFSEDEKSAFVTYKINENNLYKVSNVNIQGIAGPEVKEKILKEISNKVTTAFNVTEVDNDLKKALDIVKQEGYYFASYKVKNPKEIVVINNADKTITLNLVFESGKKSYFGDVLITGNQETKDIVVERELRIKKGEIVTPTAMNDFVNRLRGLGLFSSVNITPFVGKKRDDNSVDLNFIIKVREKDFGRGEVAPGYRTDLGYKVSFTTSYNNYKGMNRSWITKLQANYRTSLSDLDEERRLQDKHLLEGIAQIQYIEPYLLYSFFGGPLEWRTTAKFQRKRYNSFDADIFSISPSLNKTVNKYFQYNVRYEFDVVRQFDATLDIDNDRYRIGAITPSFTLDFRDNPGVTRSGAWFNFSWEFANPYFGSQSDKDLTINYNRAVLRSYFYVPIWKMTLATSLTVGAEKNFANELVYNDDGSPSLDSESGKQNTRGYIPSLKAFRLSGIDLLRGFSDNESNRLIDGTDLSDVIIRDSAYLVNFKIESRYYIDDSSVVALFLDAGRVYLENVDLKELRTSTGLSFKLLTPVGSLDFDYGIKLKRERLSGHRENFGRFHVTIGQF
ncbi:POTRA domain-containing protein [Bacteriovorax sp. Seq25_V]|uniref:POTRA domain-containing protein n=1 Tax=Bacteriovorax sp. Seq25_V TaxID=1201288 RepID=UPI00038A3929|nr:POTRA domain-containing protein [Bacteriovorax sp. Seq25_V]EQC43537.1 outer membrane protein, OMP85 family [Bacteriovorax sp. Seq25_V]